MQRPGATPPSERRPAFPRLGRVFGSAVAAAATLPPWAAAALLVAVLVAAWTRTPLPLTTFLVAVAALAGLPERAARPTAIVLLLFLALSLAISKRSVDESLRRWAVVVVGAAVGALAAPRVRALRAGRDDPRADFLVAAQRHPWIVTFLVCAVGVVDGIAGARTGGIQRPSWVLLPAVALGLAVHLTARAPDLIGRLAPVALGLPMAVLAAMRAESRMGMSFPAFAPGEPLGVIIVGAHLVLAYALSRRFESRTHHRVLAWFWAAAVPLGVGIASMGMIGLHWSLAALGVVAAPFLLSAAAELGGRPAVSVPLVSAACAALALATAAIAHWSAALLEFTGEERNATDLCLRAAEIGALWMGAGAIVRSARRLTAIPPDHAVFTEGPHVARARAEAAAAARVAAVPVPATP